MTLETVIKVGFVIIVFGAALILVAWAIDTRQQQAPEPMGAILQGNVYTVEWFPINPPRDGLHCWAAQWGTRAISYCEGINHD